jgi:hypothetical protein
VPVVFFVALEVVRGAVKRGPGESPAPLARAALNQDETAGTGETPGREHLIIALAGTGTRKEVGQFLGMSPSKLQRLVTDARKALQAVPDETAADSAGAYWDGTFEAELETSANGSGARA